MSDELFRSTNRDHETHVEHGFHDPDSRLARHQNNPLRKANSAMCDDLRTERMIQVAPIPEIDHDSQCLSAVRFAIIGNQPLNQNEIAHIKGCKACLHRLEVTLHAMERQPWEDPPEIDETILSEAVDFLCEGRSLPLSTLRILWSYVSCTLLHPEGLRSHKERLDRISKEVFTILLRFSHDRLDPYRIEWIANEGLEELSDDELIVLLFDVPNLARISEKLDCLAKESTDAFWDSWWLLYSDMPEENAPTVLEYRHALNTKTVRDRIDDEAIPHLRDSDSESRERLLCHLRTITEKMRTVLSPGEFLNLDIEFHVAIASIIGKDDEMREACEFILKFGVLNGQNAEHRKQVCLEHERIIDAIAQGQFVEAVDHARHHSLQAVRRWFPDFEADVYQKNLGFISSIPDGGTNLVLTTNVAPLEFDEKYSAKYMEVMADAIQRGVKHTYVAPSPELIERWKETMDTTFEISPDVTMERLIRFRDGVARCLAKGEERKKGMVTDEERKSMYDKAVKKVEEALTLRFTSCHRFFDLARVNETVGVILDAQNDVIGMGLRHGRDDSEAYPMIEHKSPTMDEQRQGKELKMDLDKESGPRPPRTSARSAKVRTVSRPGTQD